MKNTLVIAQHYSQAIQSGYMPTCWSAFDSAFTNRKPEIIRVQETKV